jgi:cell division protease FtsH
MLEAMQNVEAGTPTSVEFLEDEARSTAVHEAGHAIAAAVHRRDLESTRLSIRPRSYYLGVHMTAPLEERYTLWRSDMMGDLVHSLGAMAAEAVVYGDTSSGVSGDLRMTTGRALQMVSVVGMAPPRLDLAGRFPRRSDEDEARERLEQRFEEIGRGLLVGALNVEIKDRAKLGIAARMIGRAYVIAYNTMLVNRAAIDRIADVLVEKRELHGNEIVDLLDECNLVEPEIDYLEERSWPTP